MGCGSSKDKVINTTTNTTDSKDDSENNNDTKHSDKIITHTKGELNILIFNFKKSSL